MTVVNARDRFARNMGLPKGLVRPLPPHELMGFVPSPPLEEWVEAVFIDERGPLANPTYEHLRHAKIGWLWAFEDNARNGRRVLGQSELMPPMAMGKWQKARALQQIGEWFGGVPDFLVTIFAPFATIADDASFCALVEHELHHCAQEQDEFGAPKFTRDGDPKFTIRGHDVEEFVGVVERYGTAATDTGRLVEAANRGPTIAQASIAGACGTCLAKRGKA
jgi:hypothetical protein